jgi:hypothetical protein
VSTPIDPIPQYDPLVDANQKMGERWYRWLSTVVARIFEAPTVAASTHRVALTGAVAPVTLLTPTQPGAYRVSWALQVTTPATTSSSVAVVVRWTANAIAQTETFPAVTGNTTGTHAFGTVVIYPTSALPITIATTYSSTGPIPLAYALDAVVEALT